MVAPKSRLLWCRKRYYQHHSSVKLSQCEYGIPQSPIITFFLSMQIWNGWMNHVLWLIHGFSKLDDFSLIHTFISHPFAVILGKSVKVFQKFRLVETLTRPGSLWLDIIDMFCYNFFVPVKLFNKTAMDEKIFYSLSSPFTSLVM